MSRRLVPVVVQSRHLVDQPASADNFLRIPKGSAAAVQFKPCTLEARKLLPVRALGLPSLVDIARLERSRLGCLVRFSRVHVVHVDRSKVLQAGLDDRLCAVGRHGWRRVQLGSRSVHTVAGGMAQCERHPMVVSRKWRRHGIQLELAYSVDRLPGDVEAVQSAGSPFPLQRVVKVRVLRRIIVVSCIQELPVVEQRFQRSRVSPSSRHRPVRARQRAVEVAPDDKLIMSSQFCRGQAGK